MISKQFALGNIKNYYSAKDDEMIKKEKKTNNHIKQFNKGLHVLHFCRCSVVHPKKKKHDRLTRNEMKTIPKNNVLPW